MSDNEEQIEETEDVEQQAAGGAEEDFEFDTVDAGASTTEPRQCSSLRKNGFVMLKSRPCKIVEMSTSKTGKHGHAKVHLVGIDIFTNKKYEDLCPSTHNMDVPRVSRREYELTNISEEGFLELMTDDGSMKEDVRLPAGELGDQIRSKFDAGETLTLTVIKACGEEAVIGVRTATGDKK